MTNFLTELDLKYILSWCQILSPVDILHRQVTFKPPDTKYSSITACFDLSIPRYLKIFNLGCQTQIVCKHKCKYKIHFNHCLFDLLTSRDSQFWVEESHQIVLIVKIICPHLYPFSSNCFN